MKIKDAVLLIQNSLQSQYHMDEIQYIQREVLEHCTDEKYIDLVTKDFYLSEIQHLQLSDALNKLQHFMPIQYITQKAYFYSSTFLVNEHVLIPRPETEELVDLICKNHKDIDAILDIGTGSGCIIITLAKHFTDAACFAVDNSIDALDIAKRNTAKHNATNIDFEVLDILQTWPTDLPALDIIVSNPPYITTEEADNMHSNVLDYEPHNALFVKSHALEFYIRIIDQAKNALKPGGFLYFECNKLFAKDVVDYMLENGFKAEVKVDIAGNERFAIGKIVNSAF